MAEPSGTVSAMSFVLRRHAVPVQVGFSPALNDAWVAQHACAALEAMAAELRQRPLPEDSTRNLHLQLCRVLLNETFAPDNWSAPCCCHCCTCSCAVHDFTLAVRQLQACAGTVAGHVLPDPLHALLVHTNVPVLSCPCPDPVDTLGSTGLELNVHPRCAYIRCPAQMHICCMASPAAAAP